MIELDDKQVLRDFLLDDPAANAYQLGDLDPLYDDYCRWFGDRDANGALRSLLLLYTGLSLPVVITCGDADGIREIFRDVREVLPDRFIFQIREDHRQALELFFTPQSAKRMTRMGLRRENYVAFDPNPRVVRLGHRDTAAIARLYQHYPDNFFEPYQLESGMYFGIHDGDALVSIAGIHVLSQQFDVAAIGNLVTAPSHRGQGLATACTSRLLDELFTKVSLVALNTEEKNEAARRTFELFGFEPHMSYDEGRIER